MTLAEWLATGIARVMDLSLVPRHMGVRVDGFIGADVLSKFSAVRIDYKHGTAEFDLYRY